MDIKLNGSPGSTAAGALTLRTRAVIFIDISKWLALERRHAIPVEEWSLFMRALFAMVLAAGLMTSAMAAEMEFPVKARVTVDSLRVRATPSLTAAVKGVLFKNMLVTAMAQNPRKTKVGDKEDYWFRVEGEGVSGWCFGGFLEFAPREPIPDTYEGSDDLSWLAARFGDDPAKYPGTLAGAELTLDEVRSLMAAVERGSVPAAVALRYSIYPQFQGSSPDAKTAYLAKKALSPVFLKRIQALLSADQIKGMPMAGNN